MSVFYMVEMHYPLDEDRAEFNDFYAIKNYIFLRQIFCNLQGFHVTMSPEE